MKRVLYAALLLVALLFASLCYLTGSENGSRWLVTQLVERINGLEVEGISGTGWHNLQLRQLRYQSPQGQLTIEHAQLRWSPFSLWRGALRIDNIQIKRLTYRPAANASTNTAGASFVFPFKLELPAVHVENVNYLNDAQQYDIAAIEINLQIAGEQWRLKRLGLTIDGHRLETQGQLRLTAEQHLHAQIKWAYQLPQLNLGGDLEVQGYFTKLHFRHHLTNPLSLDTEGFIDLQTPSLPHLSAHTRWQALEWSLPNGKVLRSSAGDIQIYGSPQQLQLLGHLQTEWPGVPAAQLRFHARYAEQAVDIETLKIQWLDGTVHMAGHIAWLSHLQWTLDAQGQDLNLVQLHDDMPGQLDLTVRIEGAYQDQQLDLKLSEVDAQGNLRDYRLHAQGQLHYTPQGFSSPALAVQLGTNRLTLRGDYGSDVNIHVTLEAPHLQAFWPDLQGRLNAAGHWQKKSDDHYIDGHLLGHALRYADYAIETLNMKWKQQHVTLDAQNLQWGKLQFAKAHLDGDFTLLRQHWALALEHDKAHLDATAQTEQHNGNWKVELQTLQLQSPARYGGDWHLYKPAELHYKQPRFYSDEVCLQQEPARACLRLQHETDDIFTAQVQIQALPASLIKPWLAPNITIEGLVDAQAKARYQNTRFSFDTTIRPRPGRLLIRDAQAPLNGEITAFDYRDASLNIASEGQNWHVSGTVAWGDKDYLRAELTLDPAQNIRGHLNAYTDNIAWLEIFAPSFSRVRGRLKAGLEVTGTRDTPQFSGDMQLQDGALVIPELGMQLDQIAIQARAKQQQVSFAADAKLGKGQIRIDGGLQVPHLNTWQLDAQLHGQALFIQPAPQYKIWADPNLTVQLTPHALTVTGQLFIPEALIELSNGHRSVNVSPDEVILGETSSTDTVAGNFSWQSEIGLRLGSQVRFKGQGLEVGLSGDLLLSDNSSGTLRATGDIHVTEGFYKIYGQKLTIDKGTLIFQGPPDNPGLDIEAMRKVEQTVAGIRIGGTLKAPRSQVYAIPPLPDSEALALLLTGKPLNRASRSDADILVNAVASLGMERGQGMSRQISQRFGLDELSIKTESGDLQQSALLIGKYLTPRLYLRYGVSLFNEKNRLLLDYKLSEHFNLEAQSGEQQSLDILYRIER